MKFLRIIARRLIAALLIVAARAVWKREEITRLSAVLNLFEADHIVPNFSHMDAAFLTRPVPEGDTAPLPLPPACHWIYHQIGQMDRRSRHDRPCHIEKRPVGA